MILTDRLQARSLLLDEVFVQKSQLEHSLTQERKRAEEAEARVKELEAEKKEAKPSGRSRTPARTRSTAKR